MGEPAIPMQVERFGEVGSTNDLVRERLSAGVPEVIVVVADVQAAGRGREGRSWQAPAGRALLLSAGFRPTWLPATHVWRLAATVSLAMADAAEEVAGLHDGTIRLKWPNDLVVEPERVAALPPPPPSVGELAQPQITKLGGVLGETTGLGGPDPTAIIGIGMNADWPAAEFPPELAPTMTSLREAAHGRPIDREALLDAFLARLEARIAALRDGRFDGSTWYGRQVTTGRVVRLEHHDGTVETVRSTGVDLDSGALLVEDPGTSVGANAGARTGGLASSGAGQRPADPAVERAVLTGEVTRVRLVTPASGV